MSRGRRLVQGPPSGSPEPELRNARWDTRGGRETPLGLLRTTQGSPACTPSFSSLLRGAPHPPFYRLRIAPQNPGLCSRYPGTLASALFSLGRLPTSARASAARVLDLSPRPSQPKFGFCPQDGRSVLLKHSHSPKLGTLNSKDLPSWGSPLTRFQPPSTQDPWTPHPSASSDAAVQAPNLPTAQTQVSDPQPPARPRCHDPQPPQYPASDPGVPGLSPLLHQT